MALRVTDGIPIDVPVARPGLTLQDVFDSTISQALPILRHEQEAGAWCYAACAEMVITFSHQQSLANQCQIVSLVKKGENDLNFCCSTNGNECTFSGCELDDIGKIFDFWKINHETSGNAADPVLGQVDLAKLNAEFQAKRPVEVVVDWEDGGSHAVLVTAVVDDMIFVIDPLEDEPYGGWQTVFSLQEGFGVGTWSRTWPGLRRI
jgi:hypothetical protein